ncbi:MAG: BACON domain-containing protein [Candidatus Cryptobacteroides sp.]
MKKSFLVIPLAALVLACEKTPEITPEIVCATSEVAIPQAGTDVDELFVEFSSNVEWTAAIKETNDWCTVTPQKGDAGDAKVKVIATATTLNDPRQVTLVITARTAVKEIALVQGQIDALNLVEESAEIGPDGGNVTVKVMTNVDWTVKVPADCDWVKVADTKAFGEQTKTLTVSAYDELDEVRSVEISVEGGIFAPRIFTITQNGPKATLWSIDMTSVLARVNSFTNATDEVVPTNVSMALFDGDVVVCAGDGNYPVILDKATGAKKGELNTGNVKPGYITNDDAGNLVFCNRVWNYWVDYEFFTIYYITPGTKDVKKLVSTDDEEYYPSYIGAGLSVRGDVTKKASIAAPWEGVEGVTGENMVLCWQVIDGKAQSYVKGTLTGFVGIAWMQGYWYQSPDNFPGFALLSDNLTDGAVFACYDENVLYKVGADFTCTKLVEEPILDSNNAANAFDMRTINGKPYLAVSGGCYFPEWCVPAMYICDASSMSVVAAPTTHSFTQESGVGASAAVRIEAAEGGLNVYHINNNCSVIEAIWVPIK